jgi:hypothetical protein
MTEGFQEATKNNECNDVWLIVGNSLVQTNPEYIAKEAGTFFQNGYTLKRASNVQQLRDELCVILPPPMKDQEIQSSQPNNIARVSQSEPDLDEIKRFELFRSVINHEDDLLNQRVSWIILAQSFLMAAFITSPGPDSLRYVTAIVGLATVVVTMPAIIAAGQNIEVQQEVYFKMLSSDERCKELHGHNRDLKIDKNEMRQRKKHGHLLPTMAFRGRGAIRILKTVVVLAAVQFFGWVFLLMALLLEV